MRSAPLPPKPVTETAAMLCAVWSDLAPVVARLIRARPALAARLALAPPRAVHAVAIFLRHVMAEDRDDADAIAREIEHRDPRDLLSEALPGVDARLYRLLDKLGSNVRPRRFYARLDALMRGSAASLVLASPHLGEDALGVIDMVGDDPVLLAASTAIEGSLYTAQCVAAVLAYLRAMGLAHDIEALPPGSGLAAMVRRVRADLARARPPAPPFAAPPGWALVESVGDLWRIGRKLGNCVAGLHSGSAHHVRALLDGSEIMLVHAGDPLLLACIQRAGPGLWHISQVRGAGNAPAPREKHDALRDGLRRAGVLLVEIDTACAIETLAFQSEARARRHRDEVLDDAEDEAV